MANEVSRWELKAAQTIKYTSPDLQAAANELAIETLELGNDGIKRTK